MKFKLYKILHILKKVCLSYKLNDYLEFGNHFTVMSVLKSFSVKNFKYVVRSSAIDSILISERYRNQVFQKKQQWFGKTVICVGNGPSLKNTKLGLLNDQCVIGTNRAYMLLDQFKTENFELVIQDSGRLDELASDLLMYGRNLLISNHDSEKWNHHILDLLKNNEKAIYYQPKLKIENRKKLKISSNFEIGFAENPLNGIYMGRSVIFSAIQWAYYFGAKRIVCIGIDMDYTGSVSFTSGVKHIWQDFSYELHCKEMFIYFNKYLQDRGVELINATPGGKVDELRRMSLEDAIK